MSNNYYKEFMEQFWDFVLRLLAAGLLGGLVGLERMLRAKEAGIRTHFVVALGSALLMIISQYAFEGQHFDASRVAAQVVSGIGFIGAGVIIFQKNVVRGVTTAAGLWVAASIGLACGAGMYAISAVAALLVIACLETMHFVTLHHTERPVTLKADISSPEELEKTLDLFKDNKITVESYSLKGGRASFEIRVTQKAYLKTLPGIVSTLTNPSLEND